MRFAFWSCQDYTHGYYNAHEAMAREDLDFVVCLGDYIYDETYHTVKDGTGVRDDKVGRAQQASGQAGVNYVRAAETLDQTTATSTRCTARTSRCARSRRSFPTVMLWDDHEVQDNYAGGAPDGGLPPEQALLQEAPGGRLQGLLRDDALLAAAGERNRIYRRLQFGAHRRPR